MRFGFPRHHRLLKPSQFQAVLRNPQFSRGRGALRILANANTMPGARLGMIVGKRAIRRAHDRNRIKRIVRETFRRQQSTLPALDVIVQVRAPIDGAALAAEVDLVLADLALMTE